ncbi:MAG: alpha-amylase family glycosyl hydrolase [Candidatus Cloacimonadales bacterium]|nr:alpha-amylase family glycosyl hydrolase [Candidatus Cloacimonadales bacterium]
MQKLFEIKLKYIPPTGGEHKVFVAGSFNDWQQKEMQPESGNYVITLQLPAGKYSYKFIVDGHWMVDDTANFFEDDHLGGRNSVIVVKDTTETLYIVPIVFDSFAKDVFLVAISGSFNDWKTDQHFLAGNDSGKFSTFLLLPEGVYQYKFVLNDEIWLTDSANPEKISDGQDGYNSLLKVDNRFAILSDFTEEIFTYNLIDELYPRGETIGNGLLRIACRSYKNNVNSVSVLLENSVYEMAKFYSNNWYDYYSIIILEQETETYEIQLYKNDKIVRLTSKEPFQIKRNSSDLDWLQNGLIYQIFCDRFCNGDTSLNPDFSEWYYNPVQNPLSPAVQQKMYRLETDWENYGLLENDPQRFYTFYGGDLVGVRQKIPYLKQLGITCIYFNPLVQGASTHKYDTFDYLQVDPHFGGNECFKELVQECHKNGISIILDFAFNHVGLGFFAFQECLINGKKSRYFNWFDWYKWPLPKKISANFKAADYYQCWWGHATLPDLNYDLDRLHPEENYIHDINDAKANQPLVDHLLKVAEFWLLEMDIDGFRLDVPNEVPFWFWKIFRDKVKLLKAKAYLVGEIWQNAAEWLGKYFDAVMNYSFFREPVLQFFALQNWTEHQFLQEMMQGLHTYGFYNLSLMMNLLDSHDTYRFLQACDGDMKKLKLALLFQMSWIGVPHLYYGDEVGMQGGNDPDNRRPMNWKFSENPELRNLHDFVQKLISIRKHNRVLIYGDVRIQLTDNVLIKFERILENESFLVLINNSNEMLEYKLDMLCVDIIINQEVSGTISIPAFSGKLLKIK